MPETKEWRVKVVDRLTRFEWTLERYVPVEWDSISAIEPFVPVCFDWEWESGGFAKTEKLAVAEATAARDGILRREQQEEDAIYIELGD